MKKRYIVLLIIFALGIFFYLFYKEGTMPFSKEDKAVKIFVIERGAPLQTIVNNLEKNDLIRNKIIFFLIVKQLGLERKIQAGDFRLSPSMNAYEIANNLTHGTLDLWVTLIEGTRREEMAQIISRELNIPEVEFIKESEEGFLFPDTYLFPKDATAGAVISIMTNNFENKFTSEMVSKAEKRGLTINDAVILASIVEKEARKESDKKIVAGILLKRLERDWPLQVDATIQYAIGYQSSEKSWWKTALSFDDLEIKSPYNSYKNKGLPPTPICNPGLTSLNAVVEANSSTPYWYYISDKNGNMHYARTDEEHQANIDKYLQ